jgi:hypothetical protein
LGTSWISATFLSSQVGLLPQARSMLMSNSVAATWCAACRSNFGASLDAANLLNALVGKIVLDRFSHSWFHYGAFVGNHPTEIDSLDLKRNNLCGGSGFIS